MAGSGTAFRAGQTGSTPPQAAIYVLQDHFVLSGNLPRPESWLPYVFSSIDDPRLDEIVVRQNRPYYSSARTHSSAEPGMGNLGTHEKEWHSSKHKENSP